MATTGTKSLIDCLRSGDPAEIKVLIAENPEAARSAQVIVEAGRVGSGKALALLLKNGADLNAMWRGYRPLHSLIQEVPHGKNEEPSASRVAVLKWLLSKGADPEQLGGWPPTRSIVTAAFVGQPAYIEELRQAGAEIDGFVSAALGDVRRVERLLSKEPEFAFAKDPGGLTALHCCAGSRLGAANKKIKEALLAIAGLLLESGADANAKAMGWSHELDVVYFAVSAGQRELFALLLEHGADPQAALPSVMWKNEFELAEMALRHGAMLNEAVDGGKPLLNQLIRWGQFVPAMWMLEHGASSNVADEQGWTAVHQAASRGNERMMKAVLKAGGDSARMDFSGKTPLDIAKEKRHPKLASLLEDRG